MNLSNNVDLGCLYKYYTIFNTEGMANILNQDSSLISISNQYNYQPKQIQPIKNEEMHNIIQSTRNINLNTTFLIKIPNQNWLREDQIYIQRLDPHPNILGLTDYKVMSHIKPINNRTLIKLTLMPYICRISELSDVNLIKCIKLMLEALSGVMILKKKFGIKIINHNNIVIGENGEAKVWLMEKYELNPPTHYKQPSEKIVCQKFVTIFRSICLETKLSREFFEEISFRTDFKSMMEFIIQFEESQNLFSLLISSKSLSTSIGSSTHLSFSIEKQNKKRKKQLMKIQSLPYFDDCSFRDLYFTNPVMRKSQQIQQSQNAKTWSFNNKKKELISYEPPNKYSFTTSVTKGGSGFLTPTLQANRKYELIGSKIKNQSFVISEIYHDDTQDKGDSIQKQKFINKKKSHDFYASANTLHDDWQKRLAFPIVDQKLKISEDQSEKQENSQERKQGSLLQSLSESKRLSQLKEKTFKSQIIEEEQAVNPFQIIARNGWSTDLVKFNYEHTPAMKKSITMGDEENIAYQGLSLGKLDGLGKSISKSFLPVQEEDYSVEY